VAVTEHSPAFSSDSLSPLTEQTSGVVEVKVTGPPELAVAFRVVLATSGGMATSVPPGKLKALVCTAPPSLPPPPPPQAASIAAQAMANAEFWYHIVCLLMEYPLFAAFV
jgi:hypothetical protein